jgi:precorrin-8X/cobalt-precorrin-8 methylmutase
VRRVHSIEAESYRILRELVDLSCFGPLGRAVAERVIHASADLEYAESMAVDEAALEKGPRSPPSRCSDSNGRRDGRRGYHRPEDHCYVSDARTRELSEELNITRSAAGFRLAAQEVGTGAVWVVGNAPTALFELLDLPDVEPALVVGLPVGFVGAAESKEKLLQSGLPAITNRGPKGGSAVAAAALNALIYYEED